ncbi:hypothetical protein [Rhodococcus jostii]|uniref:hypothetical protein n=1 Tax=Rhodococcus jostii TaxID=132919 RepID=UPI00115FA8E1|nr:hypothetical protein [Rhodococcus jostii]
MKVEFGLTATAITSGARAMTTIGHTDVDMTIYLGGRRGPALAFIVKAVDPPASQNVVRLLAKEGGERGHWVRNVSSLAVSDSASPAH